jgi:PAS domain S-box-containing protein
MSGLADKPKGEQAEQFRLLVDAVQDYAIFMLDPEGNVASWNSGAQRIKGYAAEEIIGSHFSHFYTEADRRAHKPEKVLAQAAEHGRIEQEGWRVRKDGSRFWASITLTAIRDHDGKLLGFGKVTRDFSERRKMEARLHESERSLRDLSLHLLRSQDDERRRIGRDLHDSLGQYLAALKMHLELLARSCPAQAHLSEAIRLTDESIKEVRTLSYLLHPPLLEESGLASAVQWYLDGFSSRSQINISFEKDPVFPRLSRDLELAMFRILQEALTNVHRHSGSRTAEVRLSIRDETVVLEVEDQGSGIDPQILDRLRNQGALGIGLRGMTERMLQLGGRLEVESEPQQGTLVTAIAPLRPRATSGQERSA